jgi:uncharacterized protein (TIRG00374 family)
VKKQLFFGLIVSGICLYFVFRGLSLRDVWTAMRQAQLIWILAAMALYACGYAMRAVRWAGLIEPIQKIPAGQLVRPLIIGFFANNVLPFRMGELVRAHVTGQKFNISRTASLGTILLERICDTISFLTIFLAVAMFFPFPPGVKHAAYVLAVGCLTLIVLLFLASVHQHRAHQLLTHLPLSHRWQEKAQHMLVNFTHGVSGMKRGSFVIQALLLSMVIWLIEGSTLYLIARAFPIPFTFPEAFFLLFFLGLSVTLPQAPGYVGTVELFGVTALTLLGIPREQGLPLILTIHGMQFIFILILGVWALWKEGRLFAFWQELPGNLKEE